METEWMVGGNGITGVGTVGEESVDSYPCLVGQAVIYKGS